MAVTWGTSVNGVWKLGYEFIKVSETSTTVDVRLDIWIWCKYATFDKYNTLTVTGPWAWTGSVDFNVGVYSAWAVGNQAWIFTKTVTLNKQYGGSSASFSASLTGIEETNINYVERINGTYLVPKRFYGAPAAPSGMKAVRVADNDIRLSWTNTNPTSTTNPYQGLDVNNYVTIASNQTGEYHIDRVFNIINTYTWNKGVPDRLYRFNVNAFNDAASPPDSAKAVSNVVYTTPASCSNIRVTSMVPEGTSDPKTITVNLAWDYPSGNYDVVTNYHMAWSGPTTGWIDTPNRTCTITGLRAGEIYNFTVSPQNPGDGTQMVTGPAFTTPIQLIDVPSAVPGITSTNGPTITGTTEPRTSSFSISWTPVSGATSYLIKANGAVVGTTTNTSAIIDRLSPGTYYGVTVSAINSVGTGNPSNAVYFTTAGLPGPPSIRKFSPSPTGLEIELGAGSSNGSPISHYEYRILNQNGSEFVSWTKAPGMSFVVGGVQPGLVYILEVRSVNSVGTGTRSESLGSDAAGGRVGFWDGSKMIYRYIKTPSGANALVRTYDGTKWVLTAR